MKASIARDLPKTIGAWIRVSSEEQAKGESPEHHEKRARFYAESKGRMSTAYHHEALAEDPCESTPNAIGCSKTFVLGVIGTTAALLVQFTHARRFLPNSDRSEA